MQSFAKLTHLIATNIFTYAYESLIEPKRIVLNHIQIENGSSIFPVFMFLL